MHGTLDWCGGRGQEKWDLLIANSYRKVSTQQSHLQLQLIQVKDQKKLLEIEAWSWSPAFQDFETAWQSASASDFAFRPPQPELGKKPNHIILLLQKRYTTVLDLNKIWLLLLKHGVSKCKLSDKAGAFTSFPPSRKLFLLFWATWSYCQSCLPKTVPARRGSVTPHGTSPLQAASLMHRTWYEIRDFHNK